MKLYANALCYLRVNGEVESHQLNELGILEADLVAIVGRPIHVRVGRWQGGAFAVQVVVDFGSDRHQVGNAVHAIFVGVLPVGGLVDAIGICLHEWVDLS